MERIPSSTATIRFQDCDPFGHLNNSSYIDYMFNAREDHLIRAYDLNIFQMTKKEGRSWMTGQSEIIYLKPAFVMEEVCIESKLINFSERYVQAEMIMYDLHKTHVKSVLWSKFFYVDVKLQRGITHPPELMDLFEQLMVNVPQERINDRGLALAKEMRVPQRAERVI